MCRIEFQKTFRMNFGIPDLSKKSNGLTFFRNVR